MTDLVELAAKCRNPVVRNALLAAANGGGRERAEADRIAVTQRRLAWRDWTDARERQSALLWGGIDVGRSDDPAWHSEMDSAVARTAKARTRYGEAELATKAIQTKEG